MTNKFLPSVAIVGRPNVGKSTLFNRLCGKKLALAHNEPGITRDCQEQVISKYGFDFKLIDTPGLMDSKTAKVFPELARIMENHTKTLIKNSDYILFLIDGIEGIQPYDHELTAFLRKENKKVLIIVNKSEGYKGQQGLCDAATLGFSETLPISAEHGHGIQDLLSWLERYSPKKTPLKNSQPTLKPLKLAIIGRPNVGKSTLINSLIGNERQIVCDIAGVTRDSINIPWVYKERSIELIDTAGLRKGSQVNNSIEYLSGVKTKRSICFADVVILMIDASTKKERIVEKQDLTLASYVLEEGRCLIIALNKWDQVKNKNEALKEIEHSFETYFSHSKNLSLVPLSGKEGYNLDILMNNVLKFEKIWKTKLSTASLNQWLRTVTSIHLPPLVGGRRINFKYITQTNSKPPTFLIFCSKSKEIPLSYERYLSNSLRKEFNLPGIPLRFIFRSSKNPYTS